MCFFKINAPFWLIFTILKEKTLNRILLCILIIVNHKLIKMKNFIAVSLILISYLSYSQSTAMIAVVLEDGKESQYLAKEKN